MNLQLFAKVNTDVSIVDYLNSVGKDSSYSAREQMAKNLGISDYKGSGKQNTQMLKMLKSGAGSQVANAGANALKQMASGIGTVAGTGAGVASAGAGAGSQIVAKGVDDSLIGKINSTYTASGDVKNAQELAENAKNNLNSFSAPTISTDVWETINTPFQASSAYQEAMNYTNAMLQKLNSGRTSYTDQIREMMNQIQNREKFSYDAENDMLFQQALTSAMGSGKQAMQDTIGQASSLTGGYGSTYATSVGNQAYNAYIEDAYNNLPEYYQMAMEAYNREGQEMYNQLDMLSMADAQEYQRMYDSYNTSLAKAQNMYAQEYGSWQDSVNNAYNSANMQLQQHEQAYNQAYNTYGALQDNANTLYAQEYQSWQDKVNNAMNMAGMQNSDYWNQASMDQENRQFTASSKASGKASGGGGTGDEDEEIDYKTPTQGMFTGALEAYNNGGEAGLTKYLQTIPDYDIEQAYDYATENGEVSQEARQYTKVKDTWNGFWGIDHNDVVRDETTGEEVKISQLPDSIQKKLTDLKEGETWDFSTNSKVEKEEEKKKGGGPTNPSNGKSTGAIWLTRNQLY